MQIYIHRNNEDFGPYSREAVLEYLKQGIFQACDHACYAGMSDWKTISDLLGIAGASDPSRVTKFEEFGAPKPPQLAPKPPARHRAARMRRRIPRADGEKKKGSLIALNIVLIMIVAAVVYIRLGGGGPRARKYVAILSNAVANVEKQVADAAATPAPAIKKDSVAPQAPSISSAPQIPPTLDAATATRALTAPQTSTATQPESPSASVAPTPATDVASAAPSPSAATTPAPVAATQPAPPKPFDPVDLVGTPAAWPKMLRLKEAVAFPAVFNGQVVGDVTVPAGAVVTLVDIQGEELIVEYQGGRQKLSWKLTDLEEEVAKSGWVAPAAPPATNVTATAAASASSGN